jgi:hypothetical protein
MPTSSLSASHPTLAQNWTAPDNKSLTSSVAADMTRTRLNLIRENVSWAKSTSVLRTSIPYPDPATWTLAQFTEGTKRRADSRLSLQDTVGDRGTDGGFGSAAHYSFERFPPPLIWRFDLGTQGAESTKSRVCSRFCIKNLV